MVVALLLVALLMVLGGAVAAYQGALILAFSSGGTLVTSGVTVATGGVLLAGLAALVAAVRRLEDALVLPGEGARHQPEEAEEPIQAEPERPAAPAPDPVRAAPAAEPPLAEPLRGTLDAPGPAAPGIAGTYASGGNTYTMYTDGTVRAETPQGRFHFDTVDDLKAFIAGGGERRA